MSTVVGRFKRRQPKTASSRRAVKKMAPKVFENPKSCLFLRGAATSAVVTDAMADLQQLLKPHCKSLAKRNAFHPFDGQQHLEFLGFKNDCSLVCFGSDSKKRPHNLVLGRQFDFQMLDMVELGIVAADRIQLSEAKGLGCASLGSKPALVFEGSEFEADPFFVRLKNFLIDYFGGVQVSDIAVTGIDRAMHFSLRSRDGSAISAPSSDYRGAASPIGERGNAVLCLRHYGVVQTKGLTSELTNASNLRLVDIGPNLDLELRRVSFAQSADFKRACRVPREALAYMKNMHDNVETDAMGNLRGQLHVGKQDVTGLALRRFSAHKRQKRERAEGGAEAEAVAPKPPRPDGDVERKQRRRRKAEPAEGTSTLDVDI